jgi:hypothetical protein
MEERFISRVYIFLNTWFWLWVVQILYLLEEILQVTFQVITAKSMNMTVFRERDTVNALDICVCKPRNFFTALGTVLEIVLLSPHMKLETWFLTLREQDRFRVFESRVLQNVCGPNTKLQGDTKNLRSEIRSSIFLIELYEDNQVGTDGRGM